MRNTLSLKARNIHAPLKLYLYALIVPLLVVIVSLIYLEGAKAALADEDSEAFNSYVQFARQMHYKPAKPVNIFSIVDKE